jgi:tetratricopeptide (TPR) repeat protein
MLSWCEALAARGRSDPSLRHVHAAALAELGRWSEAERVARQALVERDSDDGSRLVLARALAARGQFDAAEAEVLAGLAAAERQPEALQHGYDLLASIWQRRADFAAVLRRLPALRAQFGHHAELWRLDAYVHTHRGDRDAALSSWRRAKALGIAPGRGEELVRLLRITDDELTQA